MSEIEIEVTLKDTATKALEAVIQAGKNLRPVLLDFGEHMVTSIQENFLRGGRPPWKPSLRALRQGGKALIDASHLMGSIHPTVSANTLKVGTNVKYARIQQFGTVGAGGTLPDIVPKQGKYLTIPLPGITRTARSYANTFALFGDQGVPLGLGSAGQGMIFQKMGKKGKIRPLFWLRKRVAIPPRPFLMLQPQDQDYLAQSAGDYLAGAWERGT